MKIEKHTSNPEILFQLRKITDLKRESITLLEDLAEKIKDAKEMAGNQRQRIVDDFCRTIDDVVRTAIPDNDYDHYNSLIGTENKMSWVIFDAYESNGEKPSYLVLPDTDWAKKIAEEFSDLFYVTLTKVKAKNAKQCHYSEAIKPDWIWYSVKPTFPTEDN